MPGELGGRKCPIWEGRSLLHLRSHNGPKMYPKVKKSGRSGLSVSRVSLVRSFRPVGPVGLVWSRRLGRPGWLRTIQRRPAAPQGQVRGGPPGSHFGAIVAPPGPHFAPPLRREPPFSAPLRRGLRFAAPLRRGLHFAEPLRRVLHFAAPLRTVIDLQHTHHRV